MVKKTIFLLVLYFLQFYLTSLRGKEYFANSRSKKNQEPEPEPLKNSPAPQPCNVVILYIHKCKCRDGKGNCEIDVISKKYLPGQSGSD